MNFNDLKNFIGNEMPKLMQHIYQPVMIKTQLESSNKAGLAEGFGRTIQPGSLAGNVKENCGDERILNYQYPEWFQTMVPNYY
jgi:hypothetical protein